LVVDEDCLLASLLAGWMLTGMPQRTPKIAIISTYEADEERCLQALMIAYGMDKPDELSLAKSMHDARLAYAAAEDKIETVIDEWWPDLLDRITTDYYDNSLEIYFEDTVEDFEPTSEQVAQFWEWGFFRCWLNFKGGQSKGGTERAYTSPELIARYEAYEAAKCASPQLHNN
jgi:hypothetical protein